MSTAAITLQVSLSPIDYPHARHILPHQLRQWAGQVADVLLVTDTHKVKMGRFAEGWEKNRGPLADLTAELSARYPNVQAVDVDFGPEATKRVSDGFFGGRPVPPKDVRGAPIYPYYWALAAAPQDIVLHVDSDMLFGGGSQQWAREAVAAFEADPDILFCSPLPGPPTRDGSLPGQPKAVPYRTAPHAFRFAGMSTRIFCLSKRRFAERARAITPRRPGVRGTARAVFTGNPLADLAENGLADAMRREHMYRVDFLGAGPGMWSLHPPMRGAEFYARLPALIDRVESGDVPDAQRGHYNIEDAFFDWSSARAARAARPWWIRVGLWATGNPFRSH